MKDKTPTDLDKEIVQMLADGMTSAEVAKLAGIGEHAMKSKILRLRERWALKSVSALCVYFFKSRWIK